jgi:glycosyltransferase involved in cell wall biosynthesis
MPRPIKREIIFNKNLQNINSKEQIDLVHAMDILSFEPAKNLAFKKNAKLIMDINEIPDIRGRIHSAFRHIPITTKAMINDRTISNLKLADLVLTTGDTCSTYANNFADIDAKTFINCRYRDIQKNKYLLRDKLNIDQASILIMFINTIAPHMGVEETISSLKKLPEYCHVCFAGRFKDETYKQETLKVIEKLSLNDRVHYVEGVMGDEYIELISGGDLGIIPLDPNFGNNEYVAPARAFDMISAELPILYTANNEMDYINKKFKIGSLIASYSTDSIVQAIKNYIDLPFSQHALIRGEIAKAKYHYDLIRYEKDFCNHIKNLFTEFPKNPKAIFVCNNSIINNIRLPRFLSLYESMGFSNTVYCINKPSKSILEKFKLKQTNFLTVEIDKYYQKHKYSILTKASNNWTGKLVKLGTKRMLNKDYSPKGKRLKSIFIKNNKDSSMLFSEKQMTTTRDFATKVKKKFGDIRYDYVITHDFFAFPSVEHFIEKYDSKHIFDVTEIPDLNERASANYRNIDDTHMQEFKQIEMRAQETATSIYSISNSLSRYLKDRYNRKVKTLLNVSPSFKGVADPFIRQQLSIPHDAILLVANCTYSNESLPFTCIDTLEHIPDNIYLLFLGNATSRRFGSIVKRYIRRKGLVERVRFHEPIYGSRYMEVLAACDIGLNIFKMDHQQLNLIFPNRVFDLIAANKPIISSPMKDIRTFNKNFNTIRLLSKETNAEEIAQSIIDTVNKFQLRQKLNINSNNHELLKIASASFDWETEAKKFSSSFTVNSGKNRILFTARQRLVSNVRIFRQCEILNKLGFEIDLVGMNEGPNDELKAIAHKTNVKLIKV